MWPWIMCRHYIIPHLKCKPARLPKPLKENESKTKNESITLHTESYEPICHTFDQYSSIVIHWLIRCRWILCPPSVGSKSYDKVIYTTPRSNQTRIEWSNKSTNETSKLLLCCPYLHPRTQYHTYYGWWGCSQWNMATGSLVFPRGSAHPQVMCMRWQPAYCISWCSIW